MQVSKHYRVLSSLSAALRKPNSVKEWNELMVSLAQSNPSSGQDELEDITEILKVRNRRCRQRPINGYAEFYLKYEPVCYGEDSNKAKIAKEIVQVIEQLEFCEKQIA